MFASSPRRKSFLLLEEFFNLKMKKTIGMKTAEFVSPKHPDKICDFIADSILDSYLAGDKGSRVAVEVMAGHKLVTINGEVTSNAKPNIEKIVRDIVGIDFKILTNLVKQSPEISRGVNIGGAGDQGIMKGYACSETKNFMPLEYELARNLCQKVFEKYQLYLYHLLYFPYQCLNFQKIPLLFHVQDLLIFHQAYLKYYH